MSKHTPGPWISPHKTNAVTVRHPVVMSDIGGVAIATWAGSEQQTDANARLIAASPDLYAVLKELQESAAYWSEYDVPLGIVDRINQAIAKAEGNA